MACTSPRRTRSSMSRLATTPGKRLVIPRSSTAYGEPSAGGPAAALLPVTPVAAIVGPSLGCARGVRGACLLVCTGDGGVDRRHRPAPRPGATWGAPRLQGLAA